jgi:hypothetical protein
MSFLAPLWLEVPSGRLSCCRDYFQGERGVSKHFGSFSVVEFSMLSFAFISFQLCNFEKKGGVWVGCEVFTTRIGLYSGYKVEFTSPCPFLLVA